MRMKTYMATPSTIERKWYVVDAADKTLGRLAAEVAKVLRGKHKPTFTPHMDTGDHVIIINADKVRLTGKKLVQKVYFRHSGYLGGDKYTKAGDMLAKNPVRMVELAVRGMVPHNRLGSQIIKKLHVYAGSEHPHAAQKPEVLTIDIR
ncbi:MAG: 50S ribosomal protein L13 [Acidaminococcus intestini]|uniref:Large ribosomal subunit protein uL13 n=2 Tax=Acidaminococcaceae TaxID=909930 RepID=A0A943EJL2_9FIRM|nr:50S ribosomal protein L13 [Acidaminococcus intestini]MBS5519495.1 50S ribosomal protein L13 [Acidaminococcus intestini]MBS6985943.1 50S ribosomal protein L13 [Acidaminococcus intestini]